MVRLVGLAVVSLLLLSATFAHAGRYILDKKGDREENYQFSDIDGVCAAYEKNLARFAHVPYGMVCVRELDPRLGFTRPTWVKLDMIEHAGLVRDIFRHLRWEDGIRNDPRPWLEQVKEMIARGDVLELARVDVDQDGKPDNLVRFGKDLSCNPQDEIFRDTPLAKSIVVANENLARVRPIAVTVRGDVILYKGKTYSDMFFGMPVPRKGRNGTLYLYEFTQWGTASECRFLYKDPTLKVPQHNQGERP